MADEGNKKLLTLTISKQKILILKAVTRSLKVRNEYIKVLHIKCINFDKVLLELGHYKSELYPNVFFFVIECEENGLENGGKFVEAAYIDVESDELNTKTVEKCFQNISHFKTSLLAVDLAKILNLDSEAEYLLLLKRALKERDEELEKILLLFTTNWSNKLLDLAFSVDNFRFILSILKNFLASQIDQESVRKIFQYSQIEFFLQVIAHQNVVNVLDILIKDPKEFTEFVNFELWNKMRKISSEHNSFEFSFKLQTLENERNYYMELYKNDENDCIAKVIKELHESIEKDEFDKVENFTNNYPDFKFCTDKEGICALDKAILNKRIKFYSFFQSKGFLSLNNLSEDLTKNLSDLKKKHGKEIFQYNRHFKKLNPHAFINKILNKCALFSVSGLISYIKLRAMLEKLSEDSELKLLLEFVADVDLTITFDFESEGVHSLNPLYLNSTTGLAYFEIGELFLGKDKTEEHLYGTFMHELMHLILCVLYENKYLPYCYGDIETENRWRKIFNDEKKKYCDNKNSTDKIISDVFGAYKEEKDQLYELAVRPCHIKAQYLNNQLKIQDLTTRHPELFEFFSKTIMRDVKMSKVVSLIKINNDFMVIKKANDYKYQVLKTNELLTFKLNPKQYYILKDDIYLNKNIIFKSNLPLLTIQRLVDEIFTKSTNKFNVRTKNLFLSSEMLVQDELRKKVNKVLEKTDIERILIHTTEVVMKNLNFLNDLKKNVQVCVICDENFDVQLFKNIKLKFEIVSVAHSCNELTQETLDKLKKKELIFQNKIYQVCEFFEVNRSISSGVLKVLCTENIKVNCEEKIVEHFIEREILQKREVLHALDFEDQSDIFGPGNLDLLKLSNFKKRKEISIVYEKKLLKDFLEDIKDDQIVLISDQAGSGKTTLLWIIHEQLRKNFPHYWTVFITLKDHLQELATGVGENFLHFVTKILNLNSLEAKVFKEKFKKGEVKILFDAFDEISPKRKTETLELFKLFKKQGGKNQIFITTRTYMEHDLQSILNILAHKLKSLEPEEQTKFLIRIWEKKYKDQRVLLEECAKELVAKISKMISTTPSVIGLPFIVEGLANYYMDAIDKNFKKKITILSISLVYENIIVKGNLDILFERYKEIAQENAHKGESIWTIYFRIAIMSFFGEKFAEEKLGLAANRKEWSPEEISRGGITHFDKDGKLKFNHETYVEFLIALFLFRVFKNFKHPSNQHLYFLHIILTEKKYLITRMFLNDLIRNRNTNEDLSILKSPLFNYFLGEKDISFLNICAKEGLIDICEMIMQQIKKHHKSNYLKMIEVEDVILKKTIFMELLPKIKDAKLFSSILNEINSLYGENTYDLFICRTDSKGNSILNHMMHDNVDSVILKKFFLHLFEDPKLSRERIKNLMFKTDEEHNTFLHACINNYQINFPKLKVVLEMIKNYLDKSEQIKLTKMKNSYKKSILHLSAKLRFNACKLIYDYVRAIYNNEELCTETKKVDSDNNSVFHHLASSGKSKDIFVSLWQKVFEHDNNVKEFLLSEGKFGRNLLQLSATNENNSDIFEFVFDITESYFPSKREKKDLLLRKNSRNHNLISITFAFGKKSSIELLIAKILKHFGKDGLKDIMLKAKSVYDKNLLNLVCYVVKNDIALKYVWEVFKSNFEKDELFRMITEKDMYGHNLLQTAAQHCESKERFNFLWSEIVNIVDDPKALFLERGNYNRNLVEHSVVNTSDPEIFKLIFSLAEKLIESKKEWRDLILSDSKRSFDALVLGIGVAPKKVLELLFDKMNIVFGAEEIKEIFIKTRRATKLNLLGLAAYNKNIDSVELVWKVLIENLSSEEIFKMIYETNSVGSTLLQHVSEVTQSKACFKLFWLNICNYSVDPMKTFMKKGKHERNILVKSSCNENREIFKTVFEMTKEFCQKKEDVAKLIFDKDKENHNLLTYCTRTGCKENLDYLFKEILPNFSKAKLKDLLMTTKGPRDQNLISLAVQNDKKDVLELLIQKFEEHVSQTELNDILIDMDNEAQNCFHIAGRTMKSNDFEQFWSKTSKKLKNPKESFLKKDESRRKILQLALQNEDIETFSICFDIAVKLCKDNEMLDLIENRDSKAHNVLTIIISSSPVKMIEYLFSKIIQLFGMYKLGELLSTMKGPAEKNLLILALENKKESFEFFWDYIKKNLRQEELLKLLTSKTNKGNNILEYLVINEKSRENFEQVIIKIRSLIGKINFENYIKVKNSEGKSLFHLALDGKNEVTFIYLLELILKNNYCYQYFIYDLFNFNYNLVHLLARYGTPSILQSAFNVLGKNLTTYELLSLLAIKSYKDKQSILHCAAYGETSETSIAVISKEIETLFDRAKVKLMLHELDVNNLSPLHIAIQNNSLVGFKNVAKIYRTYLIKSEIKNILSNKDFITLSNENKRQKDTLDFVVKYFEVNGLNISFKQDTFMNNLNHDYYYELTKHFVFYIFLFVLLNVILYFYSSLFF